MIFKGFFTASKNFSLLFSIDSSGSFQFGIFTTFIFVSQSFKTSKALFIASIQAKSLSKQR